MGEVFAFATGNQSQSSLGSECSCFSRMCCCAKKEGNMMILSERVESDEEENVVKRTPGCVVGPYWPVMLSVTYPLFIGVGKQLPICDYRPFQSLFSLGVLLTLFV